MAYGRCADIATNFELLLFLQGTISFDIGITGTNSVTPNSPMGLILTVKNRLIPLNLSLWCDERRIQHVLIDFWRITPAPQSEQIPRPYGSKLNTIKAKCLSGYICGIFQYCLTLPQLVWSQEQNWTSYRQDVNSFQSVMRFFCIP